jgi:hypothetical protein
MTIAEIVRSINSKKRLQKMQAQERAIFDYKLAELIGRSYARLHSSSNHMPSIAEAYPSLFDSEEIKEQQQEKRDQLSELRFRQFAQSYNKRFIKGVHKGNE